MEDNYNEKTKSIVKEEIIEIMKLQLKQMMDFIDSIKDENQKQCIREITINLLENTIKDLKNDQTAII